MLDHIGPSSIMIVAKVLAGVTFCLGVFITCFHGEKYGQRMNGHTDGIECWPSDDDGKTQELISKVAGRVCRLGYIPSCDVDDVKQHLTMHLWLNRKSYNPDIGGWPPYAKKVLYREGRKIVRFHRAAKRDARRSVPLSTTVSDSKMELLHLVSETDTLSSVNDPPEILVSEFYMDLNQVNLTLTPKQQQILAIVCTMNKKEMQEATGLKRKAFEKELKAVREQLSKADFPNYFQM